MVLFVPFVGAYSFWQMYWDIWIYVAAITLAIRKSFLTFFFSFLTFYFEKYEASRKVIQ